jgi:FkbM family methyltransferase
MAGVGTEDTSFMPREHLLTEPLALRLARLASQILPQGRSAVIRRVAALCRCREPFVARVGKYRFTIDLNDRVSRTLYLFGSFEKDVTALLTALLSPGQTMLDVGANFGYFSVLAADKVGPGGRVFAFEPDPRNILRLSTNVELNNARNISLVPLALFDQLGTITFNLSTDLEDNLGSSSILDRGQCRQQMQVQTTTLDAFMQEQQLTTVDLLKMDIEGAEVGALQGGRETLRARKVTHLLVELHRLILGEKPLDELMTMMGDFGYTPWLVASNPGSATGSVRDFVTPFEIHTPWRETNPHVLFTTRRL